MNANSSEGLGSEFAAGRRQYDARRTSGLEPDQPRIPNVRPSAPANRVRRVRQRGMWWQRRGAISEQAPQSPSLSRSDLHGTPFDRRGGSHAQRPRCASSKDRLPIQTYMPCLIGGVRSQSPIVNIFRLIRHSLSIPGSSRSASFTHRPSGRIPSIRRVLQLRWALSSRWGANRRTLS